VEAIAPLIAGRTTARIHPPAIQAIVSRCVATVVKTVGLPVKAVIPLINPVFAAV
jgi:hypothetical protein